MAKHRHGIGIDFGTTTSLVSERRGDGPASIVPIGRTTSWLPSLAGFGPGGLILGEDADELPADLVVRSVKRAITRDAATVVLERTQDEVSADDLIRGLFGEIARRADSAGFPLADADVRLGCPAMWTGPQRERLRGLAESAGLPADDASLIDEPIAAGISWLGHRYLAHGERKRGRLLVFDMGGGTLDIAVLDVVGGDRPEISVLSALGVDEAGDALDAAIAADVTAEYVSLGHDLDDVDEPQLAEALLQRAVRRAKVVLSSEQRTTIRLDAPFDALPRIEYTRQQLSNAFAAQLNDAEQLVLAALRQARLTQQQHADPSGLRALSRSDLAVDVDFVLLAGGMSRVPAVEERLGSLFPSAEVYADAGVAADEAIVAGLSDNTAYDRINLHRPGFDFVLQWADRSGSERTHVLYPAHTPFYTFVDAVSKSDLSYREKIPARDLPSSGEGRLLARAVSGDWLELTLDNDPCDGIAVRFGHADVVLKMQTNGRMQIVNGRGEVLSARVSGWPVIRGKDHNALRIVRDVEERGTEMTPWYWDKEYAPPSTRLT